MIQTKFGGKRVQFFNLLLQGGAAAKRVLTSIFAETGLIPQKLQNAHVNIAEMKR
jgi:hypothetical protein